jgi:hypothetical protein
MKVLKDNNLEASESPTTAVSSRMWRGWLTDGLSFVLILASKSCVLPTNAVKEARDMQASDQVLSHPSCL